MTSDGYPGICDFCSLFAIFMLRLKYGLASEVVAIIIKSLDPLKAKKTFIKKKLGHTMV